MPTEVWVLLLLVATTVAQQTALRNCDCEYMIDGKCAFTFLAETDGRSCPVSPRHLQTQLSAVQANFNSTRITMHDHMLKLNALNSGLHNLQQNFTSFSQSVSQTQSVLEQTFSTLQGQVTSLQDESSTTQGAVMTLSGRLATLQSTQEDLVQTVSSQSQQIALQNATITSLANELAELQTRYAAMLCTKRGLLVSGSSSTIPDEKITTSTAYDETHGGDRSRITINQAPGAWCPSKYIYVSNFLYLSSSPK